MRKPSLVSLIILFFSLFTSSTVKSQDKSRAPEESTIEETEVIGTTSSADDWVIFKEKDKFGIKAVRTNDVLLPAQYAMITEKVAGNFLVVSNDNNRKPPLAGLYNAQLRRMIVPLEYDNVDIYNGRGKYDFKNNSAFLVLVSRGKRTGLLDRTGKMILPAAYSKLEPDITFVMLDKDGKKGVYFYDTLVKDKAIPVEFDNIDHWYPSGYFCALKGNEYSLYDPQGTVVSSHARTVKLFYSVWGLNTNTEDILIVTGENRYGIYDCRRKTFKFLPVYGQISETFSNYYVLKKNGYFGVSDRNGREIVPFLYDTLAFIKPNPKRVRLKAKKHGSFGLIDITTGPLSKFEYDEVEDINEGFYKVRKKNRYYLLDSQGKTIPTGRYDEMGWFFNGKCAVFKDGRVGYIDQTGNVVEKPIRKEVPRGYKTVEALHTAFIEALTSDNDSTLMNFARDVSVDAYTIELLRRIPYSYNGIPENLEKRKLTPAVIAKNYYNEIGKFRDKVKKSGTLSRLKFEGYDGNNYYWDKNLLIVGANRFGVTRVDGGSKITYKLGDLLCIDGYWKSFSAPGNH